MSRVLMVYLVGSMFLGACAAPAPAAAYSLDDLTGALGRAGGGNDYGSADFTADLEAAEATVRQAGEVEQAFFSVGGQLLSLDGQDVQVFEYPDAAYRQTESDQISSDGSTIGTTMITWVDQPNFWAKGRLIVLYVGRDAATIEMLSGILGEPLTGR